MNKPQRNPDIVWRVEKRRQENVLKALEAGEEADDTGTVILLLSGMMHQLNLVGGMIWQRCDGQTTQAEIAAEIAAEFDAPEDEIAEDVAVFVTDLAERGWLIDG